MARLAHVCLESTDLAASEAFYRLLGLTRQFDFRNPAGELVGFYLKFSNETFLEIVAVRNATPEARFRHFAIEVDDIHAARAALADAGHCPSEVTKGGDGTWVATVKDPTGVFFELHQYDAGSLQRIGGVCCVNYRP
jgi:catechol 2,3-dioxygenase-like lactoylglutathione lyase family enzyme